MTAPSVEEIVAQWQDAYDRDVNHPLREDEVAALVASWRERGKAIEQMRAYQVQLEERVFKGKP